MVAELEKTKNPFEVEETTHRHVLPMGPEDPNALIQEHLSRAARWRRQGEHERAFSELIRASRAVPMTRRLAAQIVATALVAKANGTAVTLLKDGISENDGQERIHLRRLLVRLLRRAGLLGLAQETLSVLLMEKPGDRRARTVLNALLEGEGHWSELNISLEKQAKEALSRGSFRAAARASLIRGRIWREKLGDSQRAALLFGQAASQFQQANDFEGCFTACLLCLKALVQSHAAEHRMEQATALLRAAAERIGKFEFELTAVARDFQARGKAFEAAALLATASVESSDPMIQKQLEDCYFTQRAWRSLLHVYKNLAQVAPTPAQKAEYLGRAAALLVEKLNEPLGAARIYQEMVQLTGDPKAGEELSRLSSLEKEAGGIHRTVDLTVESASHDRTKAHALTLRAEAAVAAQDLAKAREDLAEALRLFPGHVRARASMMELAEDFKLKADSARLLRAALTEMPAGDPARVELLRRLAVAAGNSLDDEALADWAWSELLIENPGDAEAARELLQAARKSKDAARLERILRIQMARDPRGLEGRHARMELVSQLEGLGRQDEALALLNEAVRIEPSDREAWTELFNRHRAGGKWPEAAQALEQAASSTSDTRHRWSLWKQLADLVREKLGDDKRAELYLSRAQNLERLLEEAPASNSTQMLESPSDAHPEIERQKLYSAVQENPLSAAAHRALAFYFAENNDPQRSALMEEIADALEGKRASPARCPPLLLTSSDRVALKHPSLRGAAGEFLFAAGEALCEQLGERPPGGKLFDFHFGSGAKASLDALGDVVRILGIRSPELYVSSLRGPPFFLTYGGGARLWVASAALKKELPEDELRFFAARALFSTSPELLALRTLEVEALVEGTRQLRQRLVSGDAAGWDFVANLGLRAKAELEALLLRAEEMDFEVLAMGARHSINRAGLVACGAVGPAVRGLKRKKGLETEVAELVRFAASERYLELRCRRFDFRAENAR